MNSLIKAIGVFLLCTSLAEATIIHCEFADVNWSGFDNFYTCIGTLVDSESSENILKITGDHTNDRSNEDVVGLSIFNQLTLNQLPRNIGEFLPNLSAFGWVFGNLTTVSANDLNSIGNLTVLSLYGNQLRNLNAGLFRSQPNLQFIDFGDNSIENVGGRLLDSLPQLRWAFFQRNQCVDSFAATPLTLRGLSDQLTRQCLSASVDVTINCDFADADWAGFDSFYTCSGRISGPSNSRRVGEVIGDHVGERIEDDVTGLSIANQFELTRLPENFDDFFPNLMALDWVFGNLAFLSAQDLRSLSNLVILNLFGNRIVNLQSDVFQHTPALQFIDFGENRINGVEEGFIEGLSQLRWAFFQRNPCVDTIATTPEALTALNSNLNSQCSPAANLLIIKCEYADNNWAGFESFYTCSGRVGGPENVRSVGVISGEHAAGRNNSDVTGLSIFNQFTLTQLPENLAQSFPNLMGLDWAFGSLASVSAEDFRSLDSLVVLNLFGNRIVKLPVDLFSNTPSLRYIDFGENWIDGTGEGLIESLPQLTWAFFQRNPCIDTIATTPNALQDLSTQLTDQCESAVNLLTINCEFGDRNWSGFESFYTCTGLIGWPASARTIGVTTGDHVNERTNTQVTGLSFYNQFFLTELPNNFAQFFPNVLALDWVFGNLVSISAEDFRSLDRLIVLNLYGNRIAKLPSDLFRNTPVLQYIDFGENRFDGVGEGLIQSLPQLRWAFFLRNPCVDTFATTSAAIRGLSTQLASQCSSASNLLTINCEFAVNNWAGFESFYTCTGSVGGPVTARTVGGTAGEHMTGRNNFDVTGLSFFNQFAHTQLPNNVGQFFPNVLALDWAFGNLASISAEDFRLFDRLKVLNLYGNRIVKLPADLFRNTPILQYIDFGENLIDGVGENLIESVPLLRWAFFQRNPCINTIATTPAALRELNTQLSAQCSSASNLLTINCEFEDNNWAGFESFYTCTGSVGGPATARTVGGAVGTHVIGRNNFDVTGLSFFNQFAQTQLPNNFAQFFPNILALDWAFGNLASISADDFRSLDRLLVLNLYGNQIVKLPGDLFRNTPTLQFIDFGENRIDGVGENFIESLPKLRWAFFQRNPCIDTIATTPETIRDLSTQLSAQCSSASNLLTITCNFSDSNWAGFESFYTCAGRLTGPSNSRTVGVTSGEHETGRNNLDVTGLSFFNQFALTRLPDNFALFFPNLRALDWAFGNLASVSAEDFRNLDRLTVLNLFGNRLVNLEADLFRNTPALQFIDFGENVIENTGEGLIASLPQLRWAFFQRNPCIDTIATTPQAIRALNTQLSDQCPARDSGECPAGCVDRINSLERRIEQLERALMVLMA